MRREGAVAEIATIIKELFPHTCSSHGIKIICSHLITAPACHASLARRMDGWVVGWWIARQTGSVGVPIRMPLCQDLVSGRSSKFPSSPKENRGLCRLARREAALIFALCVRSFFLSFPSPSVLSFSSYFSFILVFFIFLLPSFSTLSSSLFRILGNFPEFLYAYQILLDNQVTPNLFTKCCVSFYS